ncbi:LTA synthase family protein [Hymenobacter radiodurans]|uniref:LTA synthase family protein n=1 Tax=Hymenobacter radiodurans TaxID=2496028 RepID=UPI00140471DC|nr:sulfatase [Hymenobacter radiodurans]
MFNINLFPPLSEIYYNFIRLLTVSYYDIIYALALCVIFSVCAELADKNFIVKKIIYFCFLFFLIISVIWALVNSYAVKILNSPINYQMLYYSDIMDSEYVWVAIAENFSWVILCKVLFVIMLVLGGGMVLYRVSLRSEIIGLTSKIILLSAICSVVYLVKFHHLVSYSKKNYYDDYVKTYNPIIFFSNSFFQSFNSERRLFTEFDSKEYENDFVSPDSSVKLSLPVIPRNSNIKNVILYVLESVPAEYVAGYENKYNATPNLQKYLPESLIFTNFYAHTPNSTNSLFSLLGSVYPLMSYKTVIVEKPDIQLPTLSSELKQRKYRTAFFQASDNQYARVDEYLSFRSFDKVVDHRQIPCSTKSFVSSAEGVGEGKDERCMVTAFSEWASDTSQDAPFFAMLWTIQTHWPYFVFGSEKDFNVKDPTLNRYLNALHQSDAALGNLLADLKQKGLYESTLVIVVGDHGESFGRHGQYGHGSNIYDENVKVPLIFINPLLFSGQKQSNIGGHVDVAATVMDILDFKKPQGWQGTSLFDPYRKNIVWLFSTWTDYFFGYRTLSHKVILNAYSNKTSVYNVKQDPNESIDLADQNPELVKLSYRRIGQWVQYNRAFLNKKLNKEDKEVLHSTYP